MGHAKTPRDDDSEPEEPEEDVLEIDLHGLPPERALRKLAQELHACRLRGPTHVLVITGRGWGNREQKPVLRPKVEAWLLGPEGRRLGVESFLVESLGGALRVQLRDAGRRREP